MNERLAVLAAVVSSALGGMGAGATRFLAGAADPLTIGAIRFGGGFLCLLPVALLLGRKWPARRDWPGVAGLGLLFFGFFPILYNLSLAWTTAGRGALALSILPLMTMLVGALLGVEKLTRRKTAGVLVATSGVAVALGTGLAAAPAGAWRGDLLMIAGAFCMALYNVWSRPFIARSAPFPFIALGMGAGGLSLAAIAAASGRFASLAAFDTGQWLAALYLAGIGSALTFFLWVVALEGTTPTRVANTITINPIAASIVGAVILAEPIGLNLLVGVAAVFAGIWIASTEARPAGALRRQPENGQPETL